MVPGEILHGSGNEFQRLLGISLILRDIEFDQLFGGEAQRQRGKRDNDHYSDKTAGFFIGQDIHLFK